MPARGPGGGGKSPLAFSPGTHEYSYFLICHTEKELPKSVKYHSNSLKKAVD